MEVSDLAKRVCLTYLNPRNIEEILSSIPLEAIDGVWEKKDRFEIYCSVSTKLLQKLIELTHPHKISPIPQKDWLKEYQAPLPPIQVGPFYISSKEPGETLGIPLWIPLKSAFGSGHHATTMMMLEAISQMDLKDKWVLDVGCGTGILTIAAQKLGAQKVVGLDIDFMAAKEARDNCLKNRVYPFIYAGTVESMKCVFDLILANLLPLSLQRSFPFLKDLLTPQGTLFMSGIGQEDQDALNFLLSQGASSWMEKEGWYLLAYPTIPSFT